MTGVVMDYTPEEQAIVDQIGEAKKRYGESINFVARSHEALYETLSVIYGIGLQVFNVRRGFIDELTTAQVKAKDGTTRRINLVKTTQRPFMVALIMVFQQNLPKQAKSRWNTILEHFYDKGMKQDEALKALKAYGIDGWMKKLAKPKPDAEKTKPDWSVIKGVRKLTVQHKMKPGVRAMVVRIEDGAIEVLKERDDDASIAAIFAEPKTRSKPIVPVDITDIIEALRETFRYFQDHNAVPVGPIKTKKQTIVVTKPGPISLGVVRQGDKAVTYCEVDVASWAQPIKNVDLIPEGWFFWTGVSCEQFGNALMRQDFTDWTVEVQPVSFGPNVKVNQVVFVAKCANKNAGAELGIEITKGVAKFPPTPNFVPKHFSQEMAFGSEPNEAGVIDLNKARKTASG